VDDKEFRNLLKMLNSVYEFFLPTDCFKKSNFKIIQFHFRNFEKKVENANAVSLTTDGWTCINNRAILK
jgi:hypothetical protein